MSNMSVMSSLFMTTRFMMLRCFRMVLGRMRVMLRRLFMMLGWCVFHLILLPKLDSIRRAHHGDRVLVEYGTEELHLCES